MDVNDVGMSLKSLTGNPPSPTPDGKQLKENSKHDVRIVDLAELILYVERLLKKNLESSSSHRSNVKPTMLMKLDVEGGEYELLPHLLMHRSLCPFDLIFLEWHNTDTRAAERNQLLESLEDSTSVRGCGAVVSSIDDETFLYDGMPFPASNVC